MAESLPTLPHSQILLPRESKEAGMQGTIRYFFASWRTFHSGIFVLRQALALASLLPLEVHVQRVGRGYVS